MSALAEFQRDLLRERVRSGIAAARKRGVVFGRRPGQRIKADRCAAKVLKLVAKGQSYREISHRLGLSKNTVLDIASSARLSSDGFFAILWRFALKRYSSASFLEGPYFLLHGYPIASTCSPASLETVSRMSDLFVERMAKSKAQEEDGSSENGQLDTGEFEKPELLSSSIEDGDEKLPPFLGKQKSKLLQLRDSLLDLMTGVSRDTLRSRAEDSEASAFGMHQADAGSDAYDRDFALSLLSQEQDALYE